MVRVSSYSFRLCCRKRAIRPSYIVKKATICVQQQYYSRVAILLPRNHWALHCGWLVISLDGSNMASLIPAITYPLQKDSPIVSGTSQTRVTLSITLYIINLFYNSKSLSVVRHYNFFPLSIAATGSPGSATLYCQQPYMYICACPSCILAYSDCWILYSSFSGSKNRAEQ